MRILWQITRRLFQAIPVLILVLVVIPLLLLVGTMVVHELWKGVVLEPGLSRHLDTVPLYPGSSVKTTSFSYDYRFKQSEYKFFDWDRSNYRMMRILTVPTDHWQNKTRFYYAVRQFYIEEMPKQGSWTFYTEMRTSKPSWIINNVAVRTIIFTHTQDPSLFLTVDVAMSNITLEISHTRGLLHKYPPYLPPKQVLPPGEELSPPPPERPENLHPKLSPRLNLLVMFEEQGRAEECAQAHNIDLIDSGVMVIIECVPGQAEAAAKAATDAGAWGVSIYSDLVGAFVPINKLTALADEESIKIIRLPILPVPATGN